MKNELLVISISVLLYACSPQIHSHKELREIDVYWSDDYGYQQKDGSHSIYFVDSIPCPENYHLLYSTNSGYSYFSVDSVDLTRIKESSILSNGIANLMVETLSFEFDFRDERNLQLFGHDNVNKSKPILGECSRYGMGEFIYERNPSYFRILLIRGDFLNGELHYFIQDGRFSKQPVAIIDPYAYYKVYVPIWE